MLEGASILGGAMWPATPLFFKYPGDSFPSYFFCRWKYRCSEWSLALGYTAFPRDLLFSWKVFVFVNDTMKEISRLVMIISYADKQQTAFQAMWMGRTGWWLYFIFPTTWHGAVFWMVRQESVWFCGVRELSWRDLEPWNTPVTYAFSWSLKLMLSSSKAALRQQLPLKSLYKCGRVQFEWRKTATCFSYPKPPKPRNNSSSPAQVCHHFPLGTWSRIMLPCRSGDSAGLTLHWFCRSLSLLPIYESFIYLPTYEISMYDQTNSTEPILPQHSLL